MMKKTKEHLSVGFDMEIHLSDWLHLKDIDHPLTTFCFFITNMLDKLFDDRIIGDWIYENIVLDDKGGFEMSVKSNCGKDKSFYINDEAGIYDHLVWKLKQNNHVDCCGGTQNRKEQTNE